MRPVMHGDVVSAACAVLPLPALQRRGAILRMLAQARAADAYRKRFGRAHPLWGNGSLMAVARGHRVGPEPGLGDPAYCACLAQVFDTLVEWYGERAGTPAGGAKPVPCDGARGSGHTPSRFFDPSRPPGNRAQSRRITP